MQDPHLPEGTKEPTSIAQAAFQAAFQRSELPSHQRRDNRQRRRARIWPPGWVTPEWSLAAPMEYSVGYEGAPERYLVEEGYPFDGASVPWPLTLLVPRTHSSYVGAAALHDYLYEKRHADVSRLHADNIFREAMLVLGLHWVWAGLMWRAVRAAGWTVWYRRKGETLIARWVRLPWYVQFVPNLLAIFVLAIGAAIFVDLPRLGQYREQALRQARRDELSASARKGADPLE